MGLAANIRMLMDYEDPNLKLRGRNVTKNHLIELSPDSHEHIPEYAIEH